MTDIKASDTPSSEQIDVWPSGRSAHESPKTAPNLSTGGDEDDPEDGAVETPPR